MEAPLIRFITVLRRNDLRISPAETLDALQAVAATGYADRATLRAALAATLVKDLADKPRFYDCFDRFFGGVGEEETPMEPEADSEDARAEPGVDNQPATDFSDIQADIHADADVAAVVDAPEISSFVTDNPNEQALAIGRAAEAAGLDQMEFATQRGLVSRRMMEALGDGALQEAIPRLQDMQTTAGDVAATWLEQRREAMREAVRDYVEQQFSLNANFAGRRIQEQMLRNTRLSAMDHYHLKLMNEQVRKLARKIARKHRRRLHRDRRGKLDMRKTLRRNMAYGGVPFHIYWKRVRRDQPKLFVLCDISGSVALYSRFLLLLLYGLQDVVPKIRSFVFSSDTAEVSELFAQYEPDQAIETAYRKWGMGSSDYGTSLRRFEEYCGADIDNNSTVIVLGDGRCNNGATGQEVLQAVYHRARLVLWLNPESRNSWNTGDSEIRRFQTACHHVAECNSLAKLERLVDRMLTIS